MANQKPFVPLFQVITRGPRQNVSVSLPSNLPFTPAGTAFMDAPTPNGQTNSESVVVATGAQEFLGFVTRNVLAQVNGQIAVPLPTLSELSEGMPPSLPLEDAFSAGDVGTLEDADEYEAEGPQFISSGNGGRDITNATAVGTLCSFYNGVTAVAQTGQRAEYYLAEIETPLITGNVRARFKRFYGQIK